MDARVIIILFLSFYLNSTLGTIQVKIVPNKFVNTSVIQLIGEDINILNDSERDVFQLTDDKLKTAIKIFQGSTPDAVVFEDPVKNFGDLYEINGFKLLSKTIKPVRSHIVSLDSVPVAILKQVFENDHSTQSAAINVQLSSAIENRMTTSWTNMNELDFSTDIKYDIWVISGNTSFSYKKKWGEDFEATETTTIGTLASVGVNLEPGQKMVAELIAYKGNMAIEVEYETSLNGDVVAIFADKIKYFEINNLLSAASAPRTLVSRQTIHLGYFSEGYVKISDSKGRFLKVFPVKYDYEECNFF